MQHNRLALLTLLALGSSPLPGAEALPPSGADTPVAPAIHFNQLGYLPDARKVALVEAATAEEFTVVRVADQMVVLRAPLAAAAEWAPSGSNPRVADFSSLSATGTYRIEVAGMSPSATFPVKQDAYSGLADAALKAFYFMRASTALDAAHAGTWMRAAGHPDTEVKVHESAASPSRPTGTVISAPGGWYDAGDYNKYIVNSGISTYTLLAAYEHFPAFFAARSVNIPESGNDVPDIIDEARWNLRWMLAMQDPEDGGVYHKLTNLQFEGMVMPEAARTPRYVVQKTTAATLDFAAVMAVASRIHAGFDRQFPGDAARMKAAAEAAWLWAKANPGVVYRQPQDVKTGNYGDRRLDDEFAWAAAELYLLTGKPEYLQEFHEHAAQALVPSWSDVGTLGLISMAHARDRLPATVRQQVSDAIEALASRLAAQWRDSAWRVAMQGSDFIWGSNAVALNQAIVLLQGYRLSGKRDYLDAAQSQLDYILGRNPLDTSFVTGIGLRSPMHIHHRPSEADGIDAPVPGLLSGGPNPGRQDSRECPVPYASSLPARAWLDNVCSYASNEIAINWNAPLVYVAAAVQTLTPACCQAGTDPVDQELSEVLVQAPEPRYVAPTTRDRIGRVWVPVILDGRGPFRLVLDTGALRSAVTYETAAWLQKPLDASPPVLLQGVTGSEVTPTIKVELMEVGDLWIQPAVLPVVESAFGGAEGLLGTDGMQQHRIFMDFANDHIDIRRSQNQRAQKGFSTVPFLSNSINLIAVDAYVGLVPVQAIIDTGAQATVGNEALRRLLRRQVAQRGTTPDEVTGATGDKQSGVGLYVDSVQLGGIQVRGARITFADLHIFDTWKMQDRPALVIGMDILGLTDQIVIDYRRRELHIKPRGS